MLIKDFFICWRLVFTFHPSYILFIDESPHFSVYRFCILNFLNKFVFTLNIEIFISYWKVLICIFKINHSRRTKCALIKLILTIIWSCRFWKEMIKWSNIAWHCPLNILNIQIIFGKTLFQYLNKLFIMSFW